MKTQEPSKSLLVVSVLLPTIATKEASPSAAPIWRNVVCTPMPVASRAGGKVEAASAVMAGRMRPTPKPPISVPGRYSERYCGWSPRLVRNQRLATAKMMPPAAPKRALP